MKRIAVTFVWVVLLGCVGAAARAQQTADDPAVRRLKELAQVISAGKPSDVRRFVEEAYGPEFKKIPMYQHLGFVMRVYDSTRGLVCPAASR
jgi:hypothetical protein